MSTITITETMTGARITIDPPDAALCALFEREVPAYQRRSDAAGVFDVTKQGRAHAEIFAQTASYRHNAKIVREGLRSVKRKPLAARSQSFTMRCARNGTVFSVMNGRVQGSHKHDGQFCDFDFPLSDFDRERLENSSVGGLRELVAKILRELGARGVK